MVKVPTFHKTWKPQVRSLSPKRDGIPDQHRFRCGEVRHHHPTSGQFWSSGCVQPPTQDSYLRRQLQVTSVCCCLEFFSPFSTPLRMLAVSETLGTSPGFVCKTQLDVSSRIAEVNVHGWLPRCILVMYFSFVFL